jgi:hypothetical protein
MRSTISYKGLTKRARLSYDDDSDDMKTKVQNIKSHLIKKYRHALNKFLGYAHQFKNSSIHIDSSGAISRNIRPGRSSRKRR